MCEPYTHESSILHPSDDRPVLVLDLDNTLVFSTPLRTVSTEFSICLGRRRFHVQVRPGAKAFLKEASKIFQIVIFTASKKEYADAILAEMAPYLIPIKCFYMDSCVYKYGYAIKDLRKLKIPLHRVLLVDDIMGSALFQPYNCLGISPWEGEPTDDVLNSELLPFLKECAKNEDLVAAVQSRSVESTPSHLSFYNPISDSE